MTKPTPRPWEFHDMEPNTIVTVKKPGQFIALCDAATFSDEENHANAALIIRAVNAHDKQMREFHNALRILLNIDTFELKAAGVIGDPLNPSCTWEAFRADPFIFFIRAPDAIADKLWALMQERM